LDCNPVKDDCPLLQTPAAQLHKALDPYQIADKTGSREFPGARLHQALTWNTPESKLESAPTICANTGRGICAWVRLDNRKDLGTKLSINSKQLEETTDPQLLLAAYHRWGERCVEHLLGDFSFCIYEPDQQSVFAARDPLGVKPLYYYHQDNLVVITSGARVFHAVNGLKLEPREEWLALYTLRQSMSFTDTCWAQVKKLAPGHTLKLTRGKSLHLAQYFSWIDNPPQTFARDDHYLESYRLVLEEAMKCRLRTAYSLGTETSGGIDSSTVTGYAAKFRNPDIGELHTFGHAYCDDEPAYILETSRLHNIANNHIVTGTLSNSDMVARSLTILGYPEEHGNGSGHEHFYRDCEQFGIRTLLSGFGGDEVVTNPGMLLFRELLDHGQYATLWRNLPGSLIGRTARLFKRMHTDRKGATVTSSLTRAFAERWPLYVLRSDIVERYKIQDQYMQQARFDADYRRINDFVLHNRLGAFVSTRFDNCTLMAAARKVEYRWPLLDTRLVQQYLSTPSIEKYGAGYGRYLHRRAIEGIVPPKVQWKLLKDMGEPATTQKPDTAKLNRLNGLATDLHPALEPLFDLSRLKTTLSSIGSLQNNRSRRITVTSHLSAIDTLNTWLNRYHS